jgi:pyruvate/2-oxoglutarate dehydrogenase complex dihydrolipoamide dehydrogenase (E3) component
MSFDYDLVILGGTGAARYAAQLASRWRARVALIEPEPSSSTSIGDDWSQQGLLSVGQMLQQIRWADSMGLRWPDQAASTLSVDWQTALEWTGQVSEILEAGRSPAILATLGVDVIIGQGEFCRRPYLAVAVNGRLLRSRRYLIATGSRAALPTIEGLTEVPLLTPDDLRRSPTPPARPDRLIVIGSTPIAVELAQAYALCGTYVTVISESNPVLPTEDPEAARLIQYQLEAEGVRVLTQAQVTQVKQLDGKKWVQAGTQALEADEILLAIGQQPQIESLNLEGVGVKVLSDGIWVNPKLQTTNPRIYACGGAIGNYPFPHIGYYEAQIALRNSLFFPRFRVDYHGLPWAVMTRPGLARVGLTEPQARQRYGDNLLVTRHYCKTIAKAQLQGEATGFCKLITRPNGEIVGGHIVAAAAEELIGTLAFAVQQNDRLHHLTQYPAILPSWADLVYQTAIAAQQQWGDRSPWWRDVLEVWFNWRRA